MTSQTSTANAPVTSSGPTLSDEQGRLIWAHIQDGMDAWQRKRSPRMTFERTNLLVRVTHPGGGCTQRMVHSFDLSAGGVGILYHGYLHTGTLITVSLPKRMGGAESVLGKVAWCRHGSGAWHGVGIKFKEPVFVRSFVNFADWGNLSAATDVQPQDLVGELLSIDDRDLDQLLLKHMLSSTKLTITSVNSAEQALTELKKTQFAVVCTDLNLGVDSTSGSDLIAQMRAAGYLGPIVALSAEGAQLERAGRDLGVSTLAKPFEQRQLFAVLSTALGVGGDSAGEPLISELANTPGVQTLLEQFQSLMQQSMRELQQSINEQSFAKVRMVCQMIRGTATGYGFPTVSTAAAEAVKALDAGGDVGEASASLQKLQQLARRISAKLAA